MDKKLKTIKNFIKTYDLIMSKDKIIVGLSGGADSVALLIILDMLYKSSEVKLYPIYVHHQLRDDADLDISFCKELCNRLSLELKVVYVDVKGEVNRSKKSVEEVARNLRYNAFNNYSLEVKANKIAVAHHMDDQAETIIHRIIRGSGTLGLSGMKPLNKMIIRPLLAVSKKDLYEILETKEQNFMEDYTNALNDYTRNKIRNQLIPLLKDEYNENIIVAINRLGQILRDEDDYMEQESAKIFKLAMICETSTKIIFDINVLLDVHKAMLNRVLRYGIKRLKGDLKNIEFAHIQRIINLIMKQSGKEVPIVKNYIAKKEYSQLIIMNNSESNKTSQKYSILLDRMPIKGYIQNANIAFSAKVYSRDEYNDLLKYKNSFKKTQNVYTKWFDYDKIETNLVLRTRNTSDRIQINRNGDTKTLKKYFSDEKISSSIREEIPLLAKGSELLWIVGHRVSTKYNVDKDTKCVLEVNLIKEDECGKN